MESATTFFQSIIALLLMIDSYCYGLANHPRDKRITQLHNKGKRVLGDQYSEIFFIELESTCFESWHQCTAHYFSRFVAILSFYKKTRSLLDEEAILSAVINCQKNIPPEIIERQKGKKVAPAPLLTIEVPLPDSDVKARMEAYLKRDQDTTVENISENNIDTGADLGMDAPSVPRLGQNRIGDFDSVKRADFNIRKSTGEYTKSLYNIPVDPDADERHREMIEKYKKEKRKKFDRYNNLEDIL